MSINIDVNKWFRLVNCIVDFVAIYLFAILINAIFIQLGFGEVILKMNNYLLNLVFGFIYYFVFESLTCRTLGKLITNTKVITNDGNKPTLSIIAIRTLCRFIPFEALSFLGLKGWHDSLSKTRVVIN